MLWSSGEACVALAAFLFSISSLFVKLTSPELSVLEICMISSGSCAVIVFIMAWAFGTPLTTSTRRDQILVALRACFGAATITCYYAAVDMASIKDATALFFTSPLFTLAFECIASRTLPGLRSSLGAVATAVGALMISKRCFCMMFSHSEFCGYTAPPPPAMQWTELAWEQQHTVSTKLHSSMGDVLNEDMDARNLMGLLLALIAAATNALAFVTIRQLGGALPALSLTFWHHFATSTAAIVSMLVLTWASSLSGGSTGLAFDPSAYMYSNRDLLLLLGIMFGQLCAQLLLNRGFSITSPTRGAAVNVLQVVFSFVWDYYVLGHSMETSSIAGGLMIVCGVLILTSRSAEKAAFNAARSMHRQITRQLSRQFSSRPFQSGRREGPLVLVADEDLDFKELPDAHVDLEQPNGDQNELSKPLLQSRTPVDGGL